MAAVVAESRAIAEDGISRVRVEWEVLPAVTDPESALDPSTPVIHPELGDNLAFRLDLASGDADRAFAEADTVLRETFTMGRHTGVTLEARAILADFDPSERRLTVYHSFQAPNMMQDILARHLHLPEHDVRVICKDVGGSFGIKVHVYPDEMATCALSVMLGRPVKFTADRLESFVSDIHAREHRVTAELAVMRDGTIRGMRVDDLTGIGPYSVYPRTSAVEGNQTVRLTPGVYRFRDYAATLRVAFQNKTPMCQYRAVGHPIAFAVMEAMVDRAARELALDPVEMRRKNYVTAEMYPHTSPTGYFFERLSHEEALDKLLELSDYRALCAERDRLRSHGVYRGLGLCAFVELTTPGPAFYGVGGARISSQDGCTVKLEPSGKLTCLTGVTEQGQGTDTMIAQVVASTVGVPMEDVRVLTGDTMVSPYGGGTWASRGAGIGGEAALQTGKALRASILRVAAAILGSATSARVPTVSWRRFETRTNANPRAAMLPTGRYEAKALSTRRLTCPTLPPMLNGMRDIQNRRRHSRLSSERARIGTNPAGSLRTRRARRWRSPTAAAVPSSGPNARVKMPALSTNVTITTMVPSGTSNVSTQGTKNCSRVSYPAISDASRTMTLTWIDSPTATCTGV